MFNSLVSLNPLAGGETLRIRSLPAVLGRSHDADLPIEDGWVSRIHCVLTAQQDRLSVRDLGSRHGVFVNGEQVIEAEIEPGDVLGLGASTWRVEFDQQALRAGNRQERSRHGSRAKQESSHD